MHFADREFAVKDLPKYLFAAHDELQAGLEAVFGASVLSLKANLLPIKIGRLLEGKLSGQRCGDYELHCTARNPNRYRVKDHGRPAPKAESYQYESKLSSDGIVKKTLVVDPRTGAPLVQKPAAATTSPDAVAPEPAKRPTRPPWIERGEMNPRDKSEWTAWQKKRLEPWSSNGLWVEPSNDPFVYASSPHSDNGTQVGWQPNGVRQSAGEVSTLWDGTLRNL